MLNRTVAYPSPNYPGRTQEGLLGQLLRKKLEPHVETWVDEGRAIHDGDEGEDVAELWAWSQEWIGTRVATYILDEAGDNYTIEERKGGVENVNTGLRRKLDEDESEEEDEDSMEDVGVEVTTVGSTATGQVEYGLEELRPSPDAKMRGVDDILRFATSRGVLDQAVRR